jgi:hypothetical protein
MFKLLRIRANYVLTQLMVVCHIYVHHTRFIVLLRAVFVAEQ